jgi:hypothetical protein
MKYMLMICLDEGAALPAEQQAAVEQATFSWVEEMTRRGVRLQGDRLRPVSDATTVRLRGRELVVTDGPFAETKEQIAGYDILECADLDAAIEVASKHPVATYGTIEIRPFWPSAPT